MCLDTEDLLKKLGQAADVGVWGGPPVKECPGLVDGLEKNQVLCGAFVPIGAESCDHCGYSFAGRRE